MMTWPGRPWQPETLKEYVEWKRRKWVSQGGDDLAPASLTRHDGDGMKRAGQIEYVNASLSKLRAVTKDGDRYRVFLELFADYGNIDPARPSSKQLRAWQASFLIDWIGAIAPDYEPTGFAQVEAARLLGQLDLFPEEMLRQVEQHVAFKAATRGPGGPRTEWREEV